MNQIYQRIRNAGERWVQTSRLEIVGFKALWSYRVSHTPKTANPLLYRRYLLGNLSLWTSTSSERGRPAVALIPTPWRWAVAGCICRQQSESISGRNLNRFFLGDLVSTVTSHLLFSKSELWYPSYTYWSSKKSKMLKVEISENRTF